MKPAHLTVWTPACWNDSGTVAGFTRTFVEALRKAAPGATLSVYAADDRPAGARPPDGRPSVDNPAAGKISHHGAGNHPRLLRRLSFAFQLFFGALFRRPALIILMDVRFAPTARLVKKFLRIPFAVATHCSSFLERDAGSRALRALIDADLVLASSAIVREHLPDAIGISAELTGVLHPPFDASGFFHGTKTPYMLGRYDLSPEQPVILTIIEPSRGSLENGYPCEQVIEAFSQIREAHPDAHYVVCGRLSDIDARKIAALLRYFNLTGHVTFTGYPSEDERCDHYNLASVLAMPTKGKEFPVTHLESMACGTPVLAGKKDGAIDTLLDGRLGILVDPDSPEEIARAITGILSGNCDLPVLYRPRELRKRVVKPFGLEPFVRTLVRHLGDLGLDMTFERAPREVPGSPSDSYEPTVGETAEKDLAHTA